MDQGHIPIADIGQSQAVVDSLLIVIEAERYIILLDGEANTRFWFSY